MKRAATKSWTAVRLGLTVAKMRANSCVRTTHECEIVNGQGMRVLETELKLPVVPFSGYAGLLSRAPERRERTISSDRNE